MGEINRARITDASEIWHANRRDKVASTTNAVALFFKKS
jgi:hypothetical protein